MITMSFILQSVVVNVRATSIEDFETKTRMTRATGAADFNTELKQIWQSLNKSTESPLNVHD